MFWAGEPCSSWGPFSVLTSLCSQFLDGTFTHEKYVCFKVLGEKGDGLLFIFMLKPSYLWHLRLSVKRD